MEMPKPYYQLEHFTEHVAQPDNLQQNAVLLANVSHISTALRISALHDISLNLSLIIINPISAHKTRHASDPTNTVELTNSKAIHPTTCTRLHIKHCYEKADLPDIKNSDKSAPHTTARIGISLERYRYATLLAIYTDVVIESIVDSLLMHFRFLPPDLTNMAAEIGL